MPISLTQNTPIYTLPGAGEKHTWIFWNKTGQPIYDLWIKTGVASLSPFAPFGRPTAGPPLMRRVELSKPVDGVNRTLRKLKVDRKDSVQVFGTTVLRMDMIFGAEDKDAFLAFMRSHKDEHEIEQVLDDVGSHLWTLWEWFGEYAESEGFQFVIKSEETFEVTVQFDDEFQPGQWVEFIPIDRRGFTINSSNRPDERTGANSAVLAWPTMMPMQKKPKKKKKRKNGKRKKN